jgi:hypothetical protein
MKVQINSLEALERLIGNDKEMEITVKSSIINAFAKNYLKSIANSTIMDKLVSTVKKEIEKTNYFGLLKTQQSGWNTYTCLTEEAKGKIKSEIDSIISSEIREGVNEYRKELKAIIKERLDCYTGDITSSLKEEVVKGTIDKMVKEKLAKMLIQ